MALIIASVVMMALCLLGLANWRQGVFGLVLMAVVQDPLRKLVPGTPGYLALVTAPILYAMVLKAGVTVPRFWGVFARQNPHIAQAVGILGFCAVIPALMSLTYGPGSWMFTLLGIFSYATIILALLVGFHFPRSGVHLTRLLWWYVALHGLAMSGAILEYYGLAEDWMIVSDAAFGFDWIRHGQGYVVEFIAGFYRSGDVMGWHAAAVIAISATLLTGEKRQRRWWLVLFLALGIFALLVCGRRKMVYMLPVFAAVMMMAYWFAGRRGRMMIAALLLTVPAGMASFAIDLLGEDSTYIRYYTEESDGTLDSLRGHGVGAVLETVNQEGFFGQGLGFATPGAHHIAAERPRVWQESTPSRLVAELGVPGFFAFLYLVLRIGMRCWQVTIQQLREKTAYGGLCAGLFSFLVANAGSLTVSGQILADPFVAAWLGITAGLILSMPRLPPDPAMDRFRWLRQRQVQAREGIAVGAAA